MIDCFEIEVLIIKEWLGLAKKEDTDRLRIMAGSLPKSHTSIPPNRKPE